MDVFQKKLLNVDEVAEKLQLPKSRIEEMARHGQIPRAIDKLNFVPVESTHKWVSRSVPL